MKKALKKIALLSCCFSQLELRASDLDNGAIQNVSAQISTISAAKGSQTDYVSVSKEDLSIATPSPVTDWQFSLKKLVVDTTNEVAKNTQSRNALKAEQKTYQYHLYFLNNAVGVSYQPEESDPHKVKSRIQTESSRIIGKRIIEQSPLWQELRNGLNFKLDFARTFTGSPAKKAKTSNAKKIRYGLILTSIEPVIDPNKRQASIATDYDYDRDLAYSSKSKVKWTIGPIEYTREDRSIFKTEIDLGNYEDTEVYSEPHENSSSVNEAEQAMAPLEGESKVEGIAAQTLDDSLWSKKVMISPVFRTRMRPSEPNLVSSDLTKSNKIGLNFTIAQDQGLYQFDFTTPSARKPKSTSEHRFKVPLVGNLCIDRVYDSKFQASSTTASSLLIYDNAPNLNVTYYEIKKQFVADAKFKVRPGTQFTARIKTNATNVAKAERVKREYSETYELGLSTKI